MCQVNTNANKPMDLINNKPNNPFNSNPLTNNSPFASVNTNPANSSPFTNTLANLVQNPQANSQSLVSLLNIVVQLIQGLQAQPQQPQQGFGNPVGQPNMPQQGFGNPVGQPNMPQQGFGNPVGQPNMPQQGFAAPVGPNHIVNGNGINQNVIVGNNNGVINQGVNPHHTGGVINNNVAMNGQPQFGQNFPGVAHNNINAQPALGQNPQQPHNFPTVANNGAINNNVNFNGQPALGQNPQQPHNFPAVANNGAINNNVNVNGQPALGQNPQQPHFPTVANNGAINNNVNVGRFNPQTKPAIPTHPAQVNPAMPQGVAPTHHDENGGNTINNGHGINQNVITDTNNGVINQEVNPNGENGAGRVINNNVNVNNPAQPQLAEKPAHPQPVDHVTGQNLPGVVNQDQPLVGGRHLHDQNNLFGNTLGGQVGNTGSKGPVGGDNTVTNGDGINQTAIVGQNNGVINQIVINNYYVYPGADMPKFNGPASPLAPQQPMPGQPAQPTTLDPVAVDKGAKAWGDPHFVGAEGGRYDIKGDNKSVYNLLSDKGIQVNSTFDNNLMQDYGVTLGNNQVSFNKAGALTINGEEVKDGDHLDGAVSKQGKTVNIKSGEYDLNLITRGNYMDIEFGSENVAADGVMPHGFWGQTADGDGEARKGSGWDGTGAIEKLDGTFAEKGDKTYQLYEVNDIFDVNFQNFNKFWGETQPTVVPTNVAAQGGAQ